MNPVFIPFAIFGVAGYLVSMIMLPQTMEVKYDLGTAGICVQASPKVVITTPIVDQAGNDICKTGKLVLVKATQS
jgi:hypothetical protein